MVESGGIGEPGPSVEGADNGLHDGQFIDAMSGREESALDINRGVVVGLVDGENGAACLGVLLPGLIHSHKCSCLTDKVTRLRHTCVMARAL